MDTAVLEMGNGNRSTFATNMNEHSSRSHSMLSIVITSTNSVTGQRYVSHSKGEKPNAGARGFPWLGTAQRERIVPYKSIVQITYRLEPVNCSLGRFSY